MEHPTQAGATAPSLLDPHESKNPVYLFDLSPLKLARCKVVLQWLNAKFYNGRTLDDQSYQELRALGLNRAAADRAIDDLAMLYEVKLKPTGAGIYVVVQA